MKTRAESILLIVLFGLSLAAFCSTAVALPAGLYPNVLTQNTTGFPSSRFTGPPDDVFAGLGGQIVTYDFFGATRKESAQADQTGNFLVTNGPGNDFNIYEVDFGAPEFGGITVFVSLDGITFFNVTATAAAPIDIDGDEAHGSATFRQSYDLGPLASARFIQIDGIGTTPAGDIAFFDLDAIGAVSFQVSPALNGIPEPASLVLAGIGLAWLGWARRRRYVR